MGTVKRNEDCTLCPLHKTAQHVCLMGRGPVPSEVMLFGEAPGKREDDIGKPFQGRSGQFLDTLLEEIDLDREDIYITNPVRCRPPDNRTPKKKEITACRTYTEMELEAVRPKFVLLLGATAAKSLLPEYAKSLGAVRGKLIEKNGVHYLATYHPSAILRDPTKLKEIKRDFQTFSRYLKGGVKAVSPLGMNLRIVKTEAHFGEMIEDITNKYLLELDIETTGLDPFSPQNKATMVGIGHKEAQWIYPLERGPFKNQETQQAAMECIGEALNGKYITGAFAKFDKLWLRVKYGLRIWLSFDTGMASWLCDENTPNGLKECATSIFGVPNWDLPQNQKLGEVSLERLANYCGLDLYYTRKLRIHFKNLLAKDEHLWDLYHRMIIPAVNAYADMEFNGAYLDSSQLGSAQEFLAGEVKTAKKKLDQQLDKAGVDPDRIRSLNLNSPKKVQALLYEDLKLPTKKIEKTKTGGYKTDEASLMRLAGHSEIPALILKVKENDKLLGSFIESWQGIIRPGKKPKKKKPRLSNGYLHPSFKLHGTVTGRPSCENPNLQQTPREKIVRCCISAPPGWTMIEGDYEQIELKIAAILSGDRAMKTAFLTGDDIHRKTACIVSGKPPSEITPEERKKAKAVNFGFLYGMGWRKFIEYARVKYGINFTQKEAQEIRRRFFETYSGLPPWHDKVRRIVRANGQVRNLIGRVRHLPDVWSSDDNLSSSAERQAINSPVQGFGSDLTQMSIVELARVMPEEKFKLFATVHDATLARVRDDYVQEAAMRMKEIMENPPLLTEFNVRLPIPITVEIKIGPWGKGEKWTPSK